MKKIYILFLSLLAMTTIAWAQCPTPSVSETTITFFRAPVTLLTGAFSVAADRQVAFTSGNLQYKVTAAGTEEDPKWRFAALQYDVIGADNVGHDPATYDGWVDLFGWATSGYDNTASDPSATSFHPWEVNSDVSTYGPSTMSDGQNLADNPATANYDWGVYNFTTGLEAGYRVLTRDEWDYLFNIRAKAASLRVLATVAGVQGLILLPDEWVAPTGIVLTNNTAEVGYSKIEYADNVLSASQWATMEEAGAVFLPAAGYRQTTTWTSFKWTIPDSGTGERQGRYWTSTSGVPGEAYIICFREHSDIINKNFDRAKGRSVRLVKTL